MRDRDQPSSSTAPRRATAHVILIVDDEPTVRGLVSTLLSDDGYVVCEAAHGEEGLEQLRRHVPDLVLLDLHMPVMDGRQFRAEQKALDSHLAAIPVLLFSGVRETLAQELEAAGAVAKPFTPEELLSVVRQTLRAAQR